MEYDALIEEAWKRISEDSTKYTTRVEISEGYTESDGSISNCIRSVCLYDGDTLVAEHRVTSVCYDDRRERDQDLEDTKNNLNSRFKNLSRLATLTRELSDKMTFPK